MANSADRSLAGLAVLIVVIGVVGWRSIGGTPVTRANTDAAVANPHVSELLPYTAPLSDTLLVSARPTDSIFVSRDPFSPASAPVVATRPPETTLTPSPPKAPAESPWRVSATLGGRRPAAIINDVLFHVGDVLPGGMTLTAVEHDRIVLTDVRGVTHTVPVKEGER